MWKLIRLSHLKLIYTDATEKRIEPFIDPINEAFQIYNIDNFYRQAAWIAQIGQESGQLRYTKEIWGPNKAQQGYEGRVDLGNTEPGDGKKFLGRGLIQLTGRANYLSCGVALGVDLIASPELLEEPRLATLSACWYWYTRGCNVPADAEDTARVTKIINGGLNGLDERIAFYNRAKDVLSIL